MAFLCGHNNIIIGRFFVTLLLYKNAIYEQKGFYKRFEFTKAYAVQYGGPIHPNSYAVTTKQVEVETGKASVQKKESIDVMEAVKKS